MNPVLFIALMVVVSLLLEIPLWGAKRQAARDDTEEQDWNRRIGPWLKEIRNPK